MSLIISMLIVVLFAGTCSKPLKKYPYAFYGIAVLLCAFGIYFTWNPSSNEVIRVVAYAVQKGQLGFSLFAVVMFIGVFDSQSNIRCLLMPVRAELSIMGSVLIIGHFIPYLKGYLGMFGSIFTLRNSILSSFLIAMVLLVLLVVLTATSFDAVKQRINTKHWKMIQKLAYPFFILVFFHLIGYLMIPAANGSMNALVNCTVYAAIFIAYGMLRIRRSLLDKASFDTGNSNDDQKAYMKGEGGYRANALD